MSARPTKGASPAANGGVNTFEHRQPPLQQQQQQVIKQQSVQQQILLPFVCRTPQDSPEWPQHPKDEEPCALLPSIRPPSTNLVQQEQQQQQQQQQYRCEESCTESRSSYVVKTPPDCSESGTLGNPPSSISDSSTSSSSSSSNGISPSCSACRGLFFHSPKSVAPPARTEEELLQPPPPPALRRDLLEHPHELMFHCTVSSSPSGSVSSSDRKKAPWWTAEAQRELFASPFDAAGFPRLPGGAPAKARLAERGAVSMDLGACIQNPPCMQQQQQQKYSIKEEETAASAPDPRGGDSSSRNCSSSPESSSSSSSTGETCSRCKGLRLTFGSAGGSHRAQGSARVGRKGPLVRAALRRRRQQQQQQQQQHASDDSSASSGSDVPAGELLPDTYLKLAGRQRDPQVMGLEADWLMRLQDPPQGIEALDVYAAAGAAAAAPAALLEPLANTAAASALTALPTHSSSSSCCSHDADTKPLLEAEAPYRPLTLLERLTAFAQSRAQTSPPLRLSLPQQQQQQQRQQRQPLPLLAALISRGLSSMGAEAAAAAFGGGSATASAGTAAETGHRQRRRGPWPIQGEAHQVDPRLLRKALRCFDRSREGLSRSSSSSSRALVDFLAVKARLVGLAFGDIPFDPDGLWLRTQQMQQQRQQQLLPDAEQQELQQQQQQRLDGMGASGTSTLPLMQAAMRRVRLSAKYRHPSVRICSSSNSSSGRYQGCGFWQKTSVDLGCGTVLATHAASAGCYYFEVLVGPVPSQQQQQQLLQLPRHRLSPQQQQLLQQQQVAVSSQCDLRVGWSTRRHPPSAPLGSTRDSVALTLRGTAAWAGVEVPCCCPPLGEGDVIGCCIRLLQQPGSPTQQPPAAAAASGAPGAAAAAAAAAAVPAAAGDAYSVSCLMDVDRLAQGFLRSAAGLGESRGGPPPVCEAPPGSMVQFTVNGRPLGPCCFKGESPGCLLVGEYFPAVSLMGGASCFVNFGPSFSYPPPAASPPYSPCCLLPLPLAPPLTFDVYPLLLLPQQLIADPELNILRPRTFADVLEQRLLAPQQQRQRSPHSHRPVKRRALQSSSAAAAAATSPEVTNSMEPSQEPEAADQQQQQQQESIHSQQQRCGGLGEAAAKQADQNDASALLASITGSSCDEEPAIATVEGGSQCNAGGAEADMVRAAHALVLSPEEIHQLQTGLRRQQQRQQLLQSIHRCAFESQLKSCHAVLADAAKEWGVSHALSLRRRKPWERHRSNLRSSSSSSSDRSSSGDSSCSSSDESSTVSSALQQRRAAEGPPATGDRMLQDVKENSSHSAVCSGATLEGASNPCVAATTTPATISSSSSSSGSGTPYVDFKNPCSVFFSFLLPTLAGLDQPPPALCVPPCVSAGQMPGGGTAASESAAAATAAWRRFARLFWLVVAPLDSQRRPLSSRVFTSNEAIAAQRKARAAATRAAATPAGAPGSSAAPTGAGTAVAGVPDASSAGGAAAAPCPSPPASRSGRSGGGPSRRKGGGGASGNQPTLGGAAGAPGAATAPTAAEATLCETVRVGQLTLRVPQGALADSEDDEGAPLAGGSPDGLRVKRAAAGSASAACSTAEEADSSQAVVALLEPLPLPLVLVRRLGLKPRQLLEALGCKFRLVSRQLAGSQAGIAGVHCIHTAVVRLRQLQAKAQAAEEEAAKDVACEFWIQQHASALCPS